MFWFYVILLTLANKRNNIPNMSDTGKRWVLEYESRTDI